MLPKLPKLAKSGAKPAITRPEKPKLVSSKKGPMRGLFRPKNPGKYIGDPQKIVIRSSWEARFFKWCDSTPAVLKWASEEFSIPYLYQAPGDIAPKVKQYFPDAFVVYQDTAGNIKKEIIEIKPMKETVLTEKSSDRDKLAWAQNQAKWKAASAFASKQGMSFRVITESSLFVGKKK